MIWKIIADAALINFGFILAYYFRFNALLFLTPATIPLLERYFTVLVFITLIWLAVFKLVGIYEQKQAALIDELASLLLGISLSSLILLGLLFLYREFWVSRLVLANAWWITLLLLAAGRLAASALVRFARSMGYQVRRVLIVGAGEISQALSEKMGQDRGLGYCLVGIVPGDSPVAKIKEIVQKEKAAEVIIADLAVKPERILDIVTECERLGVEFKILPGILELIASRVDIDELAGIPLLTVTEIRLKGLNASLKRSADLAASSLGLLALSPLFIVVAGLVKLTSPGPVFYSQERVGLDGKSFKIFKFRSMHQGADNLVTQLENRSEAKGHLFKIKNDPRITPVGRFIRRFSIDELPQLFNVLVGDMSLVGPRPPLPREVAKYSAWQMKRLRVRPGITGPWQVSGRSLLPFDDMVRLDIYYIENWSLWLDCKILLRTIPVVITGSGAY